MTRAGLHLRFQCLLYITQRVVCWCIPLECLPYIAQLLALQLSDCLTLYIYCLSLVLARPCTATGVGVWCTSHMHSDAQLLTFQFSACLQCTVTGVDVHCLPNIAHLLALEFSACPTLHSCRLCSLVVACWLLAHDTFQVR